MPAYALPCQHRVFISSAVSTGLLKISCPECHAVAEVAHKTYIQDVIAITTERPVKTLKSKRRAKRDKQPLPALPEAPKQPEPTLDDQLENTIEEPWAFGRDETERYSTKQYFENDPDSCEYVAPDASNAIYNRSFILDWQIFGHLPPRRFELFLEANKLLYGSKTHIRDTTNAHLPRYAHNKKVTERAINQREVSTCKKCGKEAVHGRFCESCNKERARQSYLANKNKLNA